MGFILLSSLLHIISTEGFKITKITVLKWLNHSVRAAHSSAHTVGNPLQQNDKEFWCVLHSHNIAKLTLPVLEECKESSVLCSHNIIRVLELAITE